MAIDSKRIVACLFVGGAAISLANAQTLRVVRNGPPTPDIAGLVAPASGVLLAAVYGAGVYRSTNAGSLWKPAMAGLASTNVNDLGRDTAAPPAIYASTDGQGIFKSTDNGISWAAVNTGLPCRFVNATRAHAVTSARLYAALACAAPNGGVARSDDGGASWSLVSGGTSGMPASTVIQAIAIDPLNADVVYASGANTGVWKSANGGANWTPINAGLVSTLPFLQPFEVAVDPGNGNNLYVAVAAGGVFRSTDAGASWTSIQAGLPSTNVLDPVTIDSIDPAIIYQCIPNLPISCYLGQVGAGGVAWNQIADGLPGVHTITRPDPGLPNYYVVRTREGVYSTFTGFANWTRNAAGMPKGSIVSTAEAATSPPTIHALTAGGLHSSTDGMLTWSRRMLPAGVTFVRNQDALVVDSANPTTLYVATQSHGILKSVNGGNSFAPVNTGLPANLEGADALVSISRVNPNVLFAALRYGGHADGRLYRSANGGVAWADITANIGATGAATQIRSIATDPADVNTLYLVTANGVYKSTTGGNTFTRPNASFTDTARALEIDPADTDIVYLARNAQDALGQVQAASGIYRSTDGGVGYTQLLTGSTAQRVALVRSGAATHLYAAAYPDGGNGLQRSLDGGATWSNLIDGMPGEAINHFETKPDKSALLRFSMPGSGIGSIATAAYGVNLQRDGVADYLWRSVGAGVVWAWQVADGKNNLGSAFLGGDASWAIVGHGDFNNDGYSDILWRQGTSGATFLRQMQGETILSSTYVGGDLDWDAWATGDFDGDGKTDILWRQYSTQATLLSRMDGATALSTAVVGGNADWTVSRVCDLNGDGRDDLIWREASSGVSVAWLSNGLDAQGNLQIGQTGAVSTFAPIVAVGDFNGDGRCDLVFPGFPYYTIVAMNGILGTGAQKAVVGTYGYVVTTGDFDGDGFADLVWFSSTTGQTNVALKPFYSTPVTALGDPNWRMVEY